MKYDIKGLIVVILMSWAIVLSTSCHHDKVVIDNNDDICITDDCVEKSK